VSLTLPEPNRSSLQLHVFIGTTAPEDIDALLNGGETIESIWDTRVKGMTP